MFTIGERIAAAREKSGVTQAELATAIGRDASAVSRLEKGERKVNSFELGLIAERLNVDIRDLLGVKRSAPSLALAARVAEAMPSSAAKPAIERVSAILEVEGLLDQLGEPSVEGPDFSFIPPAIEDPVLQGEEAARVVRQAVGNTSEPLPADLPYWVEKHFNIDVIRTELPERMLGLCVRSGDRSIVVINQDNFVLRQRFTLAHELAHHLFQDGDDMVMEVPEEHLSSKDPVEQRANAFAATLLLPDDLAKAYCGEGVSDEVLGNLILETRMSRSSLVYRLNNLGYFDAYRRDRFIERRASSFALQAGRDQEWKDLQTAERTPRPPARIVKRVLSAYRKALIGIGPVADAMLRDDREQLRAELIAEGLDLEDYGCAVHPFTQKSFEVMSPGSRRPW